MITISISIETILVLIGIIGSMISAIYKVGYDIGKNTRK